MPLSLKTVTSECKFCQQLALECTKLGVVLALDTLDSYLVHFGIIEGLVTSLCLASELVYSSWIC